MKTWIIHIASLVAVTLAFRATAIDSLSGVQELLALWAASFLTSILYIPRWPRAYALRQALRLKPGQKVEAESK